MRFKGFIGNYKSKMLIDLAEIIMGQSPDSKSYNDKSIGVPLIQGNADVINRYTSPRNFTSEPTKLCRTGDLLMTVRAPAGFVSKSLHNACIGRGMCAIRAKENKNYLFQKLLIQESRWTKYSQGSTFEAINSNDIRNLKLYMPNLAEQKKVGDFFSIIDVKIERLEEKINNLKLFKKGLFLKLYPLKKDIPIMRFKEFSDSYIETQFKKITIKKGKKNKSKTEYPMYSINNKVGFLPQEDQFDRNGMVSISDYKIVNLEEFAYNPARVNVGSIGVNNTNKITIISSLYVIFSTSNVIDNEYLYQYFKSKVFRDDVKRYEEGSVRLYLFYENFGAMRFKYPSLKEQQKVRETLLTLDNKINLLEEKIENLKQFTLQQ